MGLEGINTQGVLGGSGIYDTGFAPPPPGTGYPVYDGSQVSGTIVEIPNTGGMLGVVDYPSGVKALPTGPDERTYQTTETVNGVRVRITWDAQGNPINQVPIGPSGSGVSSGGSGVTNLAPASGVVSDPGGSGLLGTYDRFGIWHALPASLQDTGGGDAAPYDVIGGAPYAIDPNTGLPTPIPGWDYGGSSSSSNDAPDVEIFNGQPYQWDGTKWVLAPGITPQLPQSTGSRYGTYAKNAGGANVNYNSNAIASALSPLANALASRVQNQSDIDPNIKARQEAEMAILQQRANLDREMAQLDFALKAQMARLDYELQRGLITQQQADRERDRALQAAQIAAQDRKDRYDMQRARLQDQLQASNLFSQQISDVNPARFNAFLQSGGGVIANALSGGETALDDLAILPSALTLGSIRTPVPLPDPYDPNEFLGQLGGTGSGAPATQIGPDFTMPDFDDIYGQIFGQPVPQQGGGAGTGTGTGAGTGAGTGTTTPPLRLDEPSRGITAAPAIARPGAADTQAVKIGTMQHPSNQNITWDVYFEPQTGREYYLTDSGRKEYLGGTNLAEGAVLDKDFQLMDAFAAGQGITDPWAQSIAVQQAEGQLRRAGINASLSDIQALIAQGYDPALILEHAKAGTDLSQYVTGGVTSANNGGDQPGVIFPSDPMASIYASNPFSPGRTAAAGGTGHILPGPEGMTTSEAEAAYGYGEGWIDAAIAGDKSILTPPGYAHGTNGFMRHDPYLTPMGTTTAPRYMVGERGPELIEKTPFGDRITPISQLGGGGNGFMPGYAEGTEDPTTANPFKYTRYDITATSDPAGRFTVTAPDQTYDFRNKAAYDYWRSQNVGTAPQPAQTAPQPSTPAEPSDVPTTIPDTTTPPPPPGSTAAGGTTTTTGGSQVPTPTVDTTNIDWAAPGLAAALAAMGIDPASLPATAQTQALIDEIRAIREGTVIPDIGIHSWFDPRITAPAGGIYSTALNARGLAEQTKYGVPWSARQEEINRFMIPGVTRSGIRAGV